MIAATAAGAELPPIRLMIVDDSQVARTVLQRMVSASPEFEVVALASGAEEAMAALERTPVDVVLLDLDMPGGSGLDALPRIVERGKGARVLIVSSFCDPAAEAAVGALPAGAAATLAKPGGGQARGRFSEDLAERLRVMGRRNAAAPQRKPHVRAPRPTETALPTRVGCLALGASTGGVHALTALVKALPERIGAPLLVTQHLPPLFMPFFAAQLGTACRRLVRIAEEGTEPAADEVLVAPGDAHLGLTRRGGRVVVDLVRTPAPSGCMPAVDIMLSSAAEIYGPSAIGVVLSGIGRDGLDGSRRLVERGGSVFVQDRETAAVWGMPRCVAEAGLASAVLPPLEIAARIARRAEAPAWK